MHQQSHQLRTMIQLSLRKQQLIKNTAKWLPKRYHSSERKCGKRGGGFIQWQISTLEQMQNPWMSTWNSSLEPVSRNIIWSSPREPVSLLHSKSEKKLSQPKRSPPRRQLSQKPLHQRKPKHQRKQRNQQERKQKNQKAKKQAAAKPAAENPAAKKAAKSPKQTKTAAKHKKAKS